MDGPKQPGPWGQYRRAPLVVQWLLPLVAAVLVVSAVQGGNASTSIAPPSPVTTSATAAPPVTHLTYSQWSAVYSTISAFRLYCAENPGPHEIPYPELHLAPVLHGVNYLIALHQHNPTAVAHDGTPSLVDVIRGAEQYLRCVPEQFIKLDGALPVG